jgi:hypothetical protein
MGSSAGARVGHFNHLLLEDWPKYVRRAASWDSKKALSKDGNDGQASSKDHLNELVCPRINDAEECR